MATMNSKLPEIQKKANTLLKKAEVAGEIPVPIEKIVEHLGYVCESFTPDISSIDVAGAVDHRNKKILLNQNDPPKRQRFAIAYEIGHLVLQSDQKDYADYRHLKISDPIEKELDYFAACLLMPEEAFSVQWKLLHRDVNKLSDLFGVSTTAVSARIAALNLGDSISPK